MTGLVVYYGTTSPDAEWAVALSDTDVVLQPYHPILMERAYRRTFPGASRFVYLNPTTIDPWRLQRRRSRPPLLVDRDEWGLPRLNLESAAGWDCAIEEAAVAAGAGQEELHGIFLDDVDRMPDHQVRRFITELSDRLGWMPRLFVNRGFALWATLPDIDAVLIEDVRGAQTRQPDAEGPARWVREVVAPAVIAARARGARVHRIDYADTACAGTAVDEGLPPELIESEWMDAPRLLHAWPSGARGHEDR